MAGGKQYSVSGYWFNFPRSLRWVWSLRSSAWSASVATSDEDAGSLVAVLDHPISWSNLTHDSWPSQNHRNCFPCSSMFNVYQFWNSFFLPGNVFLAETVITCYITTTVGLRIVMGAGRFHSFLATPKKTSVNEVKTDLASSHSEWSCWIQPI